jgi:threonine synthase
MADLTFRCAHCGQEAPADPETWRCACGGPLELAAGSVYRPAEPLSLGEGHTPLVAAALDGRQVHLKCDHLNPTGSYKDRGAAPLVSWLRERGVRSAAEDSSGNAACALAGYGTAVGIEVNIFTPASSSPGKLAQMQAYGAKVTRVPGPRVSSFEAVLEALGRGMVYASHCWNPIFLQGLESGATEIVPQLGRAPDWLFTPCGFGTLYLGLARGFLKLAEAGKVPRAPRVVGVQAERCAPLAAAFAAGAAAARPLGNPGETCAEGIAASAPVRSRAILAECRRCDGKIIAVSEEAILGAWRDLARAGFYVEKTSAVVLAGMRQMSGEIGARDSVALYLTGNGLKAGG